MSQEVSRRDFLRKTLAGAATVAAVGTAPEEVIAQDTGMPQRRLGKTGLYVSRIGFGGGTLFWEQVQNKDEAIELVERAIEKGINFFDTGHQYGQNQEGEKMMGECIEPHRDKIIIATKTRSRGYDDILSDVEASLKNLRTDTIDLLQFHSLTKDENVENLKESMKAIEKLKSEGVIKFFGITGHDGAKVLMAGIRVLEPDTVCFPTNAKEVNQYQKTLMRYAMSQGIGIIGMKATGHRILMKLAKASDLIHYAISLSVSTLLVGMDSTHTLDSCVELAIDGRPMPSKEKEILRSRLSAADDLDAALPYHSPDYHDGHFA